MNNVPKNNLFISLWRFINIFYSIFEGLIIVLLCYPFINKSQQLNQRQKWAHRILRRLNINIINFSSVQQNISQSRYIVANHISWLDIIVGTSLQPMSFIAKAEVRSWPLIGLLARKNGTVFIKRGNPKAVIKTSGEIIKLLEENLVITIFPEGTTTLGTYVGKFHSSLFQAACAKQIAVLPIALSYHQDYINNTKTTIPAYIDDMNLLKSMWNISTCPSLYVKVQCGTIVNTVNLSRQLVAQICYQQIKELLNPDFQLELGEFDYIQDRANI